MKALPKTPAGWIGAAVTVALAGLLAWQYDFSWISTIIAILVAIGGIVGAQNLPAGGGGAKPLAIGVMLLIGLAGCSHLGVAKRATYGAYKATQTAGDGLGMLAKQAHADCLAKHGTRTPAYKTCVAPWLGRLEAWTGYARPSAVSGTSTLYGAVRLADAVGGKKARELDWFPLFQVVGCAVYRGMQPWGHLLDDKGSGVLKLLPNLDLALCEKTMKGAPAAIGAGLALAAQILSWLKQLLSDPADVLFKAVDDWLRGSQKDQSDEALRLIKEHLPPGPPR
jgi:hypothetical protein